MDYMIKKCHSIGLAPSSRRSDLTNLIVCDKVTEACVLRKCSLCKTKKIPFNDELSNDSPINYPQWVTKTEDRISGKTKKAIQVKVTSKEIVHSTVKEVKDKFQVLFESFVAHCHRIEKQTCTLREFKGNLTEKDLLVHMDFSENYACKYGTEPQSVHFGASRQMLTLHTGLVYSKNFSRGFVTLSESLRHDAPAVIAHLKPVLDEVLTNEKVEDIHFLSDGPSAQYRNKTMFYLLATYLTDLYPQIKSIIYNYSEAGHGKGAADGIGGTTKRILDSCVAHGQDIQNFHAAVTTLKEHCKKLIIHKKTSTISPLWMSQCPLP